uniref:Pre-glycoprotein polyprotein GP complex n=1 Tax=Mammarenavirus loeiense TaxID=3052313 RepID=A0A023J4Z7_9VIRU|nr:glycoprotein precursor [Mammarenavirus loeiense]
MGQIVTLFQSLPHIINEVINIVLITLPVIAILKGVYNLATCGILQLVCFLLLCGRSCSVMMDQFNLTSLELDMNALNLTMPLSCSKNNSHHYIFVGNNSGLELTLTNTSLLNHKFCNLSDAHKRAQYDMALMSIVSTFHLSIPNFNQYEAMSCDFNGDNITVQYNLSHASAVDAANHCGTVANGILETFHKFFWSNNIKDAYQLPNQGKLAHCYSTSYQFLIIQNTTWEDHCTFSRPTPLGYLSLLGNRVKQIYISRRLLGTFTWTLTDSSGSELPGGYCLSKWMLIAAEMKCFGNTAIAKCNEKHDSEFCDMLRLFDFNREAIKRLKIEANKSLNLITKAVNSLINDQLIMRNHLRDLMGIPYCNYTKFWYLNNTRTGQVSLPQCWLITNGSYLNKTEFTDDIEREANNLVTEMLQKEYAERQGMTPLGLVDIFIFSTSFYLITVFLHLVKIPTHRHLVGAPCPKPHRLNSMAICHCGLYKQPGKPTVWKR